MLKKRAKLTLIFYIRKRIRTKKQQNMFKNIIFGVFANIFLKKFAQMLVFCYFCTIICLSRG